MNLALMLVGTFCMRLPLPDFLSGLNESGPPPVELPGGLTSKHPPQLDWTVGREPW